MRQGAARLNVSATEESSRKQRISLQFAAILSLALAAFMSVRVWAGPWLSLLVFPGISVYIILIVLMSAGAWLLTWFYVAAIRRIEHDGARESQQKPVL